MTNWCVQEITFYRIQRALHNGIFFNIWLRALKRGCEGALSRFFSWTRKKGANEDEKRAKSRSLPCSRHRGKRRGHLKNALISRDFYTLGYLKTFSFKIRIQTLLKRLKVCFYLRFLKKLFDFMVLIILIFMYSFKFGWNKTTFYQIEI